MNPGAAALLLATTLGAMAPPEPAARPVDLPPPGDPLELLWSHRLDLSTGEPRVAIRIVEGMDEVALVAPAGAVLEPRGAPAVRVAGGTRLTARVRDGVPARVEWSPLLSQRESRDGDGIDRDRALWTSRGVPTRTRVTGGVYGVGGRVVDNRRTLLLAGGAFTEASAAEFGSEAWRRWGERTEAVPELLGRPRGAVEVLGPGATAIARGDGLVLLDGRGETVDVEGKGYRGRLHLTVDGRGKLAVVLLLPLEELLRGLVPSEMPSRSPAEALRAQAVTARSNLLAQIGTRHLADPWSICSDVHCQAYRGESAQVASTDSAVRSTRGEVLLDPGGGIVDGVYSALCGGHGEDNDRVWGGTASPSLRGRPDLATGEGSWPGGLSSDDEVMRFLEKASSAWCGRAPGVRADRFRWERRIAHADATRLLAVLGLGAVDGLTVLRRGASGRALSLRVDGERGSATVHGELRIRRLLGDLPSALFVVAADGDGWTLRGGGWGHGVGMCQWGAIGRATAGHGYRAILGAYFPGAEVARVY